MGILSEVAVATDTVILNKDGDKGEVRGLSLTDIGQLMKHHLKEVSQLFEGRIKIEEVATQWPVFAARIIAIAMDDPDAWEKAAKLNATTQIDALMKIWDLTIIDEDILGKAYSRLTSILSRQVVQGSPELKKPTGKKTSSRRPKS